MGNLTDDMTRLRGEIDVQRNARGALMQDLARGAKDLSSVVSAMRADFSSTHAAMARKAKRGRDGAVNSIKKRVNRMHREMAADLAGARRAWSGKTS